MLTMALVWAFCLYAGRSQLESPWYASVRTSLSGQPFWWQHEAPRPKRKKKALPAVSSVALSLDSSMNFRFERERFSHRLCKWLGLCREFQLGNKAFDDAVYIYASRRRMRKLMGANPQLAAHALKLFDADVQALYTRPGFLVAQLCQPSAEPRMQNLDSMLESLQAFRTALAAGEARPLKRRGITFWVRVYFKNIPMACFFTTVCTLIACVLMGCYIIDWQGIWQVWLRSMAVLLVFHVVLVRVVFARSSFGHEAFMHFIRQGFFSWMLCAFTVIWFANCHYDNREPVVNTVEVIEKRSQKARNVKTYHLTVRDWTGHYEARTLNVTYGVYAQVEQGGMVNAIVGQGLFALPWIKNVEVVHEQ